MYHAETFGEGCRYGTKEFVSGTKHMDAITKQEWVSNMITITDNEAYDEEVITGYVCQECGATK